MDEPSSKRQRTNGVKSDTLDATYKVVLNILKEGHVIGQYRINGLAFDNRCLIGAQPKPGQTSPVDIVLEHLSISRLHAELRVDEGGVVILSDLGSSHGTNLNGLWVKPKQPKALRVGSKVKFGGSTREYVLVEVIRT